MRVGKVSLILILEWSNDNNVDEVISTTDTNPNFNNHSKQLNTSTSEEKIDSIEAIFNLNFIRFWMPIHGMKCY